MWLAVENLLDVAYAVAGLTGCGGDKGLSPSAITLIREGSEVLPARSTFIVPFSIEREGQLFTRVDWNNRSNELNAAVLRGTCTATQVVLGEAGCSTDPSDGDTRGANFASQRPLLFDWPVMPGDHTLVVINLGVSDDIFFYRLDLN